MRKIFALITFIFFLLFNNIVFAKVVTLSKCYTSFDTRDGTWDSTFEKVWGSKQFFDQSIFDEFNYYFDLNTYEMAFKYKYNSRFYKTLPTIPKYPREFFGYFFSPNKQYGSKKYEVRMDKDSYTLYFTQYFNSGFYYDNKAKYEDKLKKAGYKWTDVSRETIVDLLGGVIRDKIYQFKGIQTSVQQCTSLSEGEIIGNPNKFLHHYYLFENKQSQKPKLFYDSSTGGMKECSHNVGIGGRCLAFKSFKSSSYDKDTLFYNKDTGRMQPCIGEVLFNGQCSAFGIFIPGMADKNQLFYNPKTKQMTTCSMVGPQGSCLSYDLLPKEGSTSSGSYIVDNPRNPYYKSVPMSADALINLGMNMLSGSCTLGLDC